jgi:hypothetical protein
MKKLILLVLLVLTINLNAVNEKIDNKEKIYKTDCNCHKKEKCERSVGFYIFSSLFFGFVIIINYKCYKYKGDNSYL